MSASLVCLRQVKRGRLSVPEHQDVAAVHDRGLTSGQIAVRLNRHQGTISNELVRIGARPPQQCRTKTYRRGSSIVKPFSPEEDIWIEALRVQGYTWAKIGELCRKRYGHARTPATIGTRLRQLAARNAA